jgi:hypothetical protein
MLQQKALLKPEKPPKEMMELQPGEPQMAKVVLEAE